MNLMFVNINIFVYFFYSFNYFLVLSFHFCSSSESSYLNSELGLSMPVSSIDLLDILILVSNKDDRNKLLPYLVLLNTLHLDFE